MTWQELCDQADAARERNAPRDVLCKLRDRLGNAYASIVNAGDHPDPRIDATIRAIDDHIGGRNLTVQ